MSTRSWRLLGAALAGLLTAGLCAGAPAAAGSLSGCASSVPFTAGTDGYFAYRIPAVVRSGAGTVLAFAEGRRDSSSDTGKIDTVLRRSFDGGCTWGPLIVAATNGTTGTAGNPVPVVLPTGRILLLTTHNAGYATEQEILTGAVPAQDSRRVFVQHSDDNGRTWSAAVDVTDQTKQANWRWYATGPGHAIVLHGGPHNGRIIVAADHSSAPPAGSTDTGAEGKYYGNNDIYSDDGGHSWHIGYTDDRADGYIEANENTVAQLPDGTVYFNSRDAGTAPGTRVDGYSTDGGASLVAPLQPQTTIAGPVVEGSTLQTTDPRELLYAGPSSPTTRAVMQLRASADDGHTWQPVDTISQALAGYSDLVQVNGSTVGLLYETGTVTSYDTVTFQRIPADQR
ncbi:MAG TPA: sialidase family protein [Pseudonocardiaceae bacterium]|nr:sialidase family protein [Pseudonocardiaceae bacterium]